MSSASRSTAATIASRIGRKADDGAAANIGAVKKQALKMTYAV